MNSFVELLKDEPTVIGKSMLWITSRKITDDQRVEKIQKRIAKKERKIEVLAKTSKKILTEREEIHKKKELITREIEERNSKIEEERKAPTLEGVSSSVEELYYFFMHWFNKLD